MKPRRSTAFTLLEVVLAIGLMVGLIGAALALHRHVQDVKGDLMADAEFTMTRWRVMDRLTAELQAALLEVRTAEPAAVAAPRGGLSGSAEQLDFFCARLPGTGAWLDRRGAAWPPEHDVQQVEYRLRYSEGGDGQSRIDGLERASRHVAPAGAAAVDQVDLIAPGIRFFRVRYHMGDPTDSAGAFAGVTEDGWVESWSGGDLPLAVELTLGRQERPGDMEPTEYLAQYPTFRRVVHLPGSRLRPVRGGVRSIR